MKLAILFLIFTSALCSANPKFKRRPAPLTGLYGMRYFPMVPYHILGMNPLLVYGSGLRPSPAVVKEASPESDLPAPYVPPPYGDMEKLIGYGGLPMPYGGYGSPFSKG